VEFSRVNVYLVIDPYVPPKHEILGSSPTGTSSDEDDPKMEPDEEHEMCVPGMDPEAGPIKLSDAEVARQRIAAKAFRAAGSPDPLQRIVLSTDARMYPSAAAIDDLVTRSRAVTGLIPLTFDPKAASSQREPADVPQSTKEQQAPPPRKGQESPEAKASHPMVTRQRASASGAGGLRGVVGSGQTGYVCDKPSPSSKPGS
jgi:hypothetical protein